jgi:hypothetical protein
MRTGPLGPTEAVELCELLEFCADALDEHGDSFLKEACMDRTELRATLLSWALRLLDTPATEVHP